MVKRSSVVLVVGLLYLAVAVTASAAQVEERTFPLKADGSVSVENSAGNTIIHAWAEEQVKMIATRKGSGADKIEIVIDAQEDRLKIETEYPRFSWFQRARVNYELWVPQGATVRAVSTSGDLYIEEQHNDVRAQTTSGDVELIGIWGEIDVGATSGSIRTENSKGTITARASSGDIKILELRGGVRTIRTSSGDIWVELEEIDKAISEMSFQSTSGGISLSVPSDIGADVDIRTTSGRISTDLAITVEGTMGRNELQGTIGGGGIFIKLKATSGDVSLRKV